MPDETEETDEPGELQYVEDFLDANTELVRGIVGQLVEHGTADYSNDSGTLSLIAHRPRWRQKFLEHAFTMPDGRRGTGAVVLSKDAFDPPQRSLNFYVAALLADMQPQSQG